MSKPSIDIDYEGNGGSTTTQETKEDVTHLNGDDTTTQLDKEEEEHDETQQKQDEEQHEDHSSTGELEVGTELEFEGVTYHIDENKNLVDAEGNIFKKAEEVKEWIEGQDVVDENDNDSELTIESLQQALGIEIKDENGNAVEFTNDAAGIKSYVDSVIELRTKDVSEATLNKFFADAPVVKEFVDYLVLNNGNPQGFGQLRDRSGVKLDKENEGQLEQVIRAAAAEFGNKSINDNYIKFLKETGGLYDEAQRQLENLVEKDKAVRADVEKRAQEARDARQKEVKEYWNRVNSVIESRNIAGYKIADSFVVERDGKKITQTPNDFISYITRKDKETGLTAYQADLDRMSEDDVLNAELLDAWLHFTGKTYSDLQQMAIKEDNVRKLVIKSKNSKPSKGIKIRKPNATVNADDIQYS